MRPGAGRGAAGILLALSIVAPSLARSPAGAASSTLIAGAFAPQSPSEDGPGLPPPAFGSLSATRATADRDDAASGRQTHVLYFVPKDRIDRQLDTSGAIGRSVAAMTDWFQDQAGRHPRLDLTLEGFLDVTFVAGSKPAASYKAASGDTFLDAIASELQQRAGLNSASKRYLVYAEIPGRSTCGEGFWPGRFAAVYLGASSGCGARDLAQAPTAGSAGKAEAIAAQEWIHNEGAVPAVAPHACAIGPGHVCTGALALAGLDPEAPDVMFPYINGPLSAKRLDPGRDDYYGHRWPTADVADSPWLE